MSSLSWEACLSNFNRLSTLPCEASIKDIGLCIKEKDVIRHSPSLLFNTIGSSNDIGAVSWLFTMIEIGAIIYI